MIKPAEISEQRSLEYLLPLLPENFNNLSTEEQSFYRNIRYVILNLESARTYIQVMRRDYKMAIHYVDSAYMSASDNAKTKEERAVAKAIKERTEGFLRNTSENIKYITRNLSECIHDMRPLLQVQDQF